MSNGLINFDSYNSVLFTEEDQSNNCVRIVSNQPTYNCLDMP